MLRCRWPLKNKHKNIQIDSRVHGCMKIWKIISKISEPRTKLRKTETQRLRCAWGSRESCLDTLHVNRVWTQFMWPLKNKHKYWKMEFHEVVQNSGEIVDKSRQWEACQWNYPEIKWRWLGSISVTARVQESCCCHTHNKYNNINIYIDINLNLWTY
jgi:hypothetical protein